MLGHMNKNDVFLLLIQLQKLHPHALSVTSKQPAFNLVVFGGTLKMRKFNDMWKKMKNRKKIDKTANGPTTNKVEEAAGCSKASLESGQIRGQKASEEYNVILLSETGVGKSTFINALANYLTYEKLGAAEKKEPLVLIPGKFSTTDENHELHIVEFGEEDSNENTESIGESATQSCNVYEYPVTIEDIHDKMVLLRIIDTPGIGDTRGIEQDQANIMDILNFIDQYDSLHAICILLKPNEPRMTVGFAYCFKELLSHLHVDASNNILFVFTNSRSTSYLPGETVTPLTVLLDKIRAEPSHPQIPFDNSNIFCFDNEAFRYLAALNNGVQFGAEDRECFSKSWDKSAEESERLVRYIVKGSEGQGLTPHNVQDTLAVTKARDAIIDWAKIITDITEYIQLYSQLYTGHLIRHQQRCEKRRKDEIGDPNISQNDSQKEIQSLTTKIKMYEDYEQLLTNNATKLATFLKKKAMVVNNDAIEGYLKMLQQEKNTRSLDLRNADIIDRLEIMLQNYEIGKTFLEKAIKNHTTTEEVTAEEVEQIIRTITEMNIGRIIFNDPIPAPNRDEGAEGHNFRVITMKLRGPIRKIPRVSSELC